MIFPIGHCEWMKSVAQDFASRHIPIIGFQRYRGYWFAMVYGESTDDGEALWAGVRIQGSYDTLVNWTKEAGQKFMDNARHNRPSEAKVRVDGVVGRQEE